MSRASLSRRSASSGPRLAAAYERAAPRRLVVLLLARTDVPRREVPVARFAVARLAVERFAVPPLLAAVERLAVPPLLAADERREPPLLAAVERLAGERLAVLRLLVERFDELRLDFGCGIDLSPRRTGRDAIADNKGASFRARPR
jgi:hypothetical protein